MCVMASSQIMKSMKLPTRSGYPGKKHESHIRVVAITHSHIQGNLKHCQSRHMSEKFWHVVCFCLSDQHRMGIKRPSKDPTYCGNNISAGK